MKVAAVVPYWLDRPPLEALEIAQTAERMGLDELWVGEMLTFDAFALAGAIARETSDLTIVCGPLAVGVRSPVALALGVASVASLGGRPAHLALGASSPTVVRDWHEREWAQTATRASETVDATRALLAGERRKGFKLRERLVDTQIRLAAFGRRMVRVAAASADGVVVNLLTTEAAAAVKRAVADAAETRARAAPPLAAWVPAAYEPGEATMNQLRTQLAVYLAQPGYAEMFVGAGFEGVVEEARRAEHPRAVAAIVPDDLLHAICALGDERALRDRFAEYEAAGVDTLCVVPATAEDPGGEKVLQVVAGLSEGGET